MTVLNTAADYRRLIEALRGFELPVTIGFEATGNYHRALMFALGAAGFELKLVSSVALARIREALHNSWDKNDPKDAQVILHMLQIGAVQVFHDPLVAGTSDIQELSKTYEMVARSKTELWHRILTHYLPLYFPEADRFHRSSRGDWFFAFLEAFPSPHMITAMDKETFIQVAWPVIGRRVKTTMVGSLGRSRCRPVQSTWIFGRAVPLSLQRGTFSMCFRFQVGGASARRLEEPRARVDMRSLSVSRHRMSTLT